MTGIVDAPSSSLVLASSSDGKIRISTRDAKRWVKQGLLG